MGIGEGALFVIGVLVLSGLVTALLERAAVRHDPGPATAAPLAQAVDPPNADRWLYPAGGVMAALGVAFALVVIPFGPERVGRDLGIGAFYLIVVLDFVVLGVALAGWGANTPGAVDAYYRIVAQLVSYIIPLGLAYVGAIMMARSLSTVAIVEAQAALPFVVLQPLGFALYLVTGLMQAYRAPFAEPFANAVQGGVLGVVGGWKALFWRLSLAGLLFVVAAMGVVLYLGGWHGPWPPGPVWMLLKTFGLMALMLSLGRTVKPLSTAQMLALSWRVLTPVGLANVLLVGALILLGIGPS